ncbi:ABC transporter substrate-binding protein [Carnobacterium gallinarum]|uniref:ABC transporter substrate-binding protein n=1 Tax=Carnobacterium gallinarum TaxID=2749 RepID=UPI0005535256|nr:ABC transporter substrate-binding protein [Carnobacterium gallinarum]
MKKVIIGLASLAAVAVIATGCASGGSSEKDSKTIKIGANLELSGPVSAYGTAELDGINLAIDEINKNGGVLGKQLSLVDLDNKSDKAEAASVATKLATKEKVVAIVGPATSGTSKAATPSVTKAKVPMVTPSGTDDTVTVENGKVWDYVYRVSFQDSFQGVTLANFAQDNLGAKKAVIIGDSSSDYAKGLTKSFKDSFKGKIVDEVNFTTGDKDFKAVLTKIKDKDFDVLYMPSYYEEAGLIIKQARELGITQPILGADGFGNDKLVDLAQGKNLNNVYYTAHYSNKSEEKKVVDFVAAFKAKYNKAPDAFSALAYDAVYMIAKAIENAGEATPEKVKDELAKIKDFDGITGNITMDKNHNPIKSTLVIKLENGEEVSNTVVKP